ncbi:MAG: M48 family metallopeptidase [Brevefilum sp.]|nr:M48 family metallopeptidase [Brevefilum sp.]
MKSPSPEIPEIIRTQRKSFGLEITPDGQLIVRAPKSASDAQIKAVIAQKAAWISNARARLAAQYPDRTPHTFAPGETFWYLGDQYSLHLVDHQRPLLDLDGSFHLAQQAHSQAKQIFIAWYREETRHITHKLIVDYTKRFNLKVNRVRITSARTRWGSCSGKGNLNFTYRLCMAPLEVIEYVVVHELAHLKVPNHSRTFWVEVAKMYPDYQKQRNWLKQHGYRLNLD